MILNSETVELVRQNAKRLANAVRSKEDLVDLATSTTFEQTFSAIETLLTNTEMYFDEEILSQLDEESWREFKAIMLVYTLNDVNRKMNFLKDAHSSHSGGRDFGASL